MRMWPQICPLELHFIEALTLISVLSLAGFKSLVKTPGVCTPQSLASASPYSSWEGFWCWPKALIHCGHAWGLLVCTALRQAARADARRAQTSMWRGFEP